MTKISWRGVFPAPTIKFNAAAEDAGAVGQ
jgi:hypothetical protein